MSRDSSFLDHTKHFQSQLLVYFAAVIKVVTQLLAFFSWTICRLSNVHELVERVWLLNKLQQRWSTKAERCWTMFHARKEFSYHKVLSVEAGNLLLVAWVLTVIDIFSFVFDILVFMTVFHRMSSLYMLCSSEGSKSMLPLLIWSLGQRYINVLLFLAFAIVFSLWESK